MALSTTSAKQLFKGEFEGEGLSREQLIAEYLWTKRHEGEYLVKIGGCEARSDLNLLRTLGVTRVTAPMIESAFAMRKYMGMFLPTDTFDHIGVTIETKDAVRNIGQILQAGTLLSCVTIGRSDLCASLGEKDVDGQTTMEMVQKVADEAGKKNLIVTMGGGVSTETRALLLDNPVIARQIDFVETRKVVIPMSEFLSSDALERAIKIELELLALRSEPARGELEMSDARRVQIERRLGRPSARL